jgi:hypothetical protein
MCYAMPAAVAVMCRISLAMLVAAATLVAPRAVAASADWCWDDPIVVIGGRSVSINIGVYGAPADVRRNVSAADVTIYVPAGTVAFLSVSANRFFRENVEFVPVSGGALAGQPIPVTVVVTFRATKEMPAAMRITSVLTLQAGHLLASSGSSSTTHGRMVASFVLY